MAQQYPWYEVTEDRVLLQGDLLQGCPILEPSVEMLGGGEGLSEQSDIPFQTYDVVIMSQSCDLIAGKIQLVLLCPYSSLERMTEENAELREPKFREKIRRGEVFGHHMLNKCEYEAFHDDYLIVDFRSVFALPLAFLKDFVSRSPKRLRLLPPYREHLSQAFARFFMRVGLPTEIPRFV